jgi:FeS assembly SUF system protein
MIAADDTTLDAPNAPRWTFDPAIDEAEQTRLRDDIVAACKTVFDPEIPCDIYELGLIYKIEVPDNRMIAVEMTLTAPGCPVAGDIIASVEEAVGTVAGTMGTTVDLVFDPPWDQGRMSDEARISLDMF